MVFLSGLSQIEQVAFIFWAVYLNIQEMLLQKRSTFRFQSLLEPCLPKIHLSGKHRSTQVGVNYIYGHDCKVHWHG